MVLNQEFARYLRIFKYAQNVKRVALGTKLCVYIKKRLNVVPTLLNLSCLFEVYNKEYTIHSSTNIRNVCMGVYGVDVTLRGLFGIAHHPVVSFSMLMQRRSRSGKPMA